MNRRHLMLAGAAALAASPALAADDLTSLARDAWVYAVPLIETANQRAGVPPNRLVHRRVLADFRSRGVTTPNNDTLYSSAQLDLSGGPVTLTLPRFGSRYYSVQLMDAYTNSFSVLGTRTIGGQGGTYTIGLKGAKGPNLVVSPTPHVWLLTRILISGPEELDAVHALQDGMTLTGPARPPAPAFARRNAPWAEFLAAADKLMVADPPPTADKLMLERLAKLGVGQGRFDPTRFSTAEAAKIQAGLDGARADRRPLGDVVRGKNGAVVGNFGTDYDLRAQVAIGGLAALPPEEAAYMRVPPPPGGFDGSKLARLHFAAGGLPPVNAFWSLTMYQPTADGQLFFIENPIGRYAIGDRTTGLVKNADGSLDIWIGADDPGPERRANWLPAPKGPYALNLRGYLPKPAMIEGRWRPPPLTPG
jgi:hypothetical protein